MREDTTVLRTAHDIPLESRDSIDFAVLKRGTYLCRPVLEEGDDK